MSVSKEHVLLSDDSLKTKPLDKTLDIVETAIDISRVQSLKEWSIELMSQSGIANREYEPAVQRVKAIFDYAGLNEPKDNVERFVQEGESLVVLPPNPTITEKFFGRWVALDSSQKVQAYSHTFGLQNTHLIPIVLYRTNDEMSQIAKNVDWSGVLSLSYAPFLTTLNLQAAQYCLETLGPRLGAKAIQHSVRHENGHPMMERERLKLLQESGLSLGEYAESTRALLQKAFYAYEMAADDIHDPVENFQFTWDISTLEARDPLITPVHTIGYSYDDTRVDENLQLEMDEVMYPKKLRLSNGAPVEVPFVMSPQWAHANLLNIELISIYRKTVDPDFTWTKYLLRKIKEDPLVKTKIPIPEGMDQCLAKLESKFS